MTKKSLWFAAKLISQNAVASPTPRVLLRPHTRQLRFAGNLGPRLEKCAAADDGPNDQIVSGPMIRGLSGRDGHVDGRQSYVNATIAAALICTGPTRPDSTR